MIRTGGARRFDRSAFVFALAVGAAGVLATPFYLRAVAAHKPGGQRLITEVVKRRPLRISLTDGGFVDSSRNVTIASQVESKTTILAIAPEGTRVKRGDVVCELDASLLREQLQEHDLLLVIADSLLKRAQLDVEIQKLQNASDLAAAELKQSLAELDLDKFLNGEFPNQRSEIQAQIDLAGEYLRRLQDGFQFRKQMAKRGYYRATALDADRNAVQNAETTLKIAEGKRRGLHDYTRVRTLRELEANQIESRRALERTSRKSQAALMQAQVRENAQRRIVQTRRNQVARLQRNLAACTIRAPQDGDVIYAQPQRRSGSSNAIEAGAEVNYRQDLIKLPDLSQMKVYARIHETRIGQMREGLPAIIKCDALPGQVFHGFVRYVSSVPLSGSWPNYDLREYEAVITVDDYAATGRLKPGLTAHIEIEVDERDAVLQVPMQAVVELGDQHYSCVLTDDGPEMRTVHIGRSNDNSVEILDGLSEGENVVLNPRAEFPEELDEMSDRPAESPALQHASRIPRTAEGG